MSESQSVRSGWAALVVGSLFGGIGLIGLACNIPHFGEFALRARTETREQAAFDGFGSSVFGGGHAFLGNGKVVVWLSGFESGADALFFMFLFAIGAGIAVGPFLSLEAGRRFSLLLALAWHGLGIATCVCFVRLAPTPYDARPFLALGIFEWLGLVLIALAVRKERRLLHEAVWGLWGGIVPGAILGGIVGVLIDLGSSMPPPQAGYMQVFRFSNAVYGCLIGGLASGITVLGITGRRALGGPCCGRTQ